MKQKPAPAMTLFEVAAPSRDIAWQVVSRIPLNASFRQEQRDHKLYWYATWTRENGKMAHVYVGNDAKMEGVRACHALVRAELAEAEKNAEPHLSELRQLEARAYTSPPRGPGRPRQFSPDGPGVVSVPIIDPKARTRRPRGTSGGTR